MTTATRLLTAPLIVGLVVAAEVRAQPSSPAWRFGADSQVGVTSRGTDPGATGVVVDSVLAAEWGSTLQLIARPVSRGRLQGEWSHDFYQLGARYQPTERLPLRIEAGYALAVIGLGVLRARPIERDTSSLDPQYVRPLPRFEPGLPTLWAVTPSYPLVAVASIGTPRYDVRLGVADGSPTRMRGVIRRGNPPRAPQAVIGAGLTPVTGLRVGITMVSGDYLTPAENPDPAGGGRRATLAGVELEYSFGHTAITAEWIRNTFEIPDGTAIASSGFLRVTHALSPRWRLSGRYDLATPPHQARTLAPPVGSLRSVEGLVGYRLTRDLVVRGFVLVERSFFETAWNPRAGVTFAIARRWR